MNEGITKRKYPRRTYECLVGVLSKGQYLIGNSFEIGEMGMLIGSEHELSENDRIVLSFHVDNNLASVIQGTIKYHSNKDGVDKYGVQFNDSNFSVRRIIRRYVSERT